MSDDNQNSFNTHRPGDDSSSPDSKPASDIDSRLEHMESRGFTPSQALGRSRPSGAWEPPTPEELQSQMPQYKVLDVLGRGGMGAVYKGWQTSLDRYVAIKILPPDLEDGDVSFSARFKQEAKTMARLSHPGIVPVFDAGETVTGLFYFVMEFVEGSDVSQMVRQQGKLDPAHALAITAHVCDALTYAHEHGVIHRDIKPANIMLNQEGQVKVADFGLAKSTELGANSGLTKTTMTVGTPDFIAPEALVMGVYSDHRADLYAVGVMLYNMLTGEIPRGRWKLPSERVGSDVRFDAIINKAMETEREDRYQSAREIRRELDVIQSTPLEKVSPPLQQAAPARKPVMQEREHSPEAPASKPAASPSPPKRGAKVAKVGASRKKSNTVPIFAVGGVLAALAVGAIFLHKPKSSLHANATKGSPFVNTLGMKFVPVPITGGPSTGLRVLFSVWDTRVQDFEVFAKDIKRKLLKPDFEQGPDHPAVNVSWDDARSFCAWLTLRERAAGKIGSNEEYRLPSDHEWSCAVGIGDQEDAAVLPGEKSGKIAGYSWGPSWPPPKGSGNFPGEETNVISASENDNLDLTKVIPGYNDGFVYTSPVGSFAANRFGLFDMSGNVQQWCEDWYDNDRKKCVGRGASWKPKKSSLKLEKQLTVSFRDPTFRNGYKDRHIGFRCVLAPSVSASANPANAATPPTPPNANTGPINLLSLIDPLQDSPQKEKWELRESILTYRSGSGAADLRIPLDLRSKFYQLDIEFSAEFTLKRPKDDRIEIMLPNGLPGSEIAVRFRGDGSVHVGHSLSNPSDLDAKWTATPTNSGHVGVRWDIRNSKRARLELLRDGIVLGTWSGDPATLSREVSMKRNSIGTLIGLGSSTGNPEIRRFTLTLFEGEASSQREPRKIFLPPSS